MQCHWWDRLCQLALPAMTNRRDFFRTTVIPAGALFLGSTLPSQAQAAPVQKTEPGALSKKLRSLTRNTVWRLADQIKVQFKTFHCQGMVKSGEYFWVSSVEVESPASGAADRSKGKGHLFKIDNKGQQLADIAIGEGSIYHPSGIDFDGTSIWIAAAEYRPDSQAIIYKFNPQSMQLQEMFRWQDHIGGILRHPASNTLH